MMKKLRIILFLKLLEIYMCRCKEDPCAGETWTLSVAVNMTSRQGVYQNQKLFQEPHPDILYPHIHEMFNGKVSLNTFELEGDLLANLDKHQTHMKGFPRNVTLFLNLYGFYKINLGEVFLRNYEYIILDEETDAHLKVTVNKCPGKKYPCKINVGHTQRINDSVAISSSVNDCAENDTNTHIDNKNCVVTNKIYNKFLLVSNNVLKFPDLYAYIYHLIHHPVGYYSNRNKISIKACRRPLTIYVDNINAANPIIGSSSSITIKNAHSSDYEAVINDPTTIAFLAKGPFVIPGAITAPTIFYDEHSYASPYPEKSYSFVNFFPWMPEEKSIFALIKFLKYNEWKRVAIISDDTTVSREFEQKLTAMLEKEEFIYTSRSCDVANCNYSKILTPIVSQHAKIIIANIEYDEKSDFANQVKQWTNLIWIFRSPAAAKHAHTQGIRNVYSVYKGNPDLYYKSNNFLTVLKAVVDYVGSRKELKPTTNNMERKALAEAIKNKLYKNTEIDATILQYSDKDPPSVMARMTITPSNAVIKYVATRKLNGISTELSYCTIPSKVYMKPCYDTEYMFLMLVVSIFLLMILVIVYFFQSAEVSYTRFSN